VYRRCVLHFLSPELLKEISLWKPWERQTLNDRASFLLQLFYRTYSSWLQAFLNVRQISNDSPSNCRVHPRDVEMESFISKVEGRNLTLRYIDWHRARRDKLTTSYRPCSSDVVAVRWRAAASLDRLARTDVGLSFHARQCWHARRRRCRTFRTLNIVIYKRIFNIRYRWYGLFNDTQIGLPTWLLPIILGVENMKIVA